ncbi:MAG: GGDEF domain-containing protein [Deltaproteobacteria bacterium]|jgi:diguanylate cyclase|nr:GGDEF domain-containing protein [Deltaproteobacteria bacterium]
MSSDADEKTMMLQDQVKKLQSQKDILLKELDVVEERFEKINRLYRRYFPVIIDSVAIGDNAFSRICKDLSQALKKGVSEGKLEYIFERLKTAMFREDIASLPGEKKKGLFSAFQKSGSELFIDAYKLSYYDVVNNLRSNLDKQYTGKLDNITKRIRTAEDTGDISDIRENVFRLVFAYISDTSQDRYKVNAFVLEIAGKIFDIESTITSSFEYTGSMFQSNDEFEEALNFKITDLEQIKDVSSSLDDFKIQVAKRLSSIKKALETKQTKDQAVKKLVRQNQDAFKTGFSRLKQELDKATKHSEELEKKLDRDQLTGAYNRRAYDRRVEEEMERFLRYGTMFSLLMMDADKFKLINDDYGHTVGDKCLQEIIKRTLPLLRKNDMLARYEGDEFVIILPGTDKAGAKKAAEKIRKNIERIGFLYKSKKIKVTVSIGVSQSRKGDKDHLQIFERADIAVYKAKEQGRNTVVVN